MSAIDPERVQIVTFKLLAYVIGCLGSLAAVNFVTSVRIRQILLLAVSYALYALWGAWFLGILIFSSFVNYGLGAYLRRRITTGRLWLGIAFNVALLGTFKYLPEIANAAPSSEALHAFRQLILPLGISFWTFQALSYLFDLYREEDLRPSPIEFLLYITFWPTAISGPICRLTEMLPQFRHSEPPSWDDYGTGMRRIGLGLFMLGVAQILGGGLIPEQGINAGFSRVDVHWSGADVWLLAIGYGFQLFMDFAGYSHLMIGAARLLGFRLQENFDKPFLSTSPSVFWTRWHMSLSFWIRDYVFLPLASFRRGLVWRNFTLVVAMVLFGLWHRGSWLFLLWGAYHGVLLVLHRQWQQVERRTGLAISSRIVTPVGWAYTFAAISLGWILFRANGPQEARSMLGAVFSPATYSQRALPDTLYLTVAAVAGAYFACLMIGSFLDRLASMSFNSPRAQRAAALISKERWVWVVPVAVVLAVYAFVVVRPGQTVAPPMLYRLF